MSFVLETEQSGCTDTTEPDENIDIVEEVNYENGEASIELEENKEDEPEHDENNTSRLADKVAVAQPQA